ncbi:MAG TPA: FMN-dependent NADH-azoreductase [Gammaproteobacteria bacterium]|nr:FMN-dependent NADH-azoreductase [Gammaproteobacteria bacterium]MEC8012523.1 NAD(P)H-dependent oxidoreductase [Pseudomonadota bacterium]HBF09709.1 FMN-dependent NADH-azoreductase [Gammaproteobacteria bacterium]HCK91557.1 FMN-dependent NADH-azoreductase [Gammaproteobacteria bacterium]|tara:strand:- start:811 stop:1413 length:603 start_codon:yes stop_codon:yes gene_type:complete
MAQLLQINSSIFAENGKSTQLADAYISELKKNNPDTKVKVRDFTASPIPHLDAARMGAFMTPAEERNDEQKAVVAFSDELINEIREADAIVLTLPMYNFGIPSNTKAYFDHIARAGVTFKYTETGPLGLLEDKPVYIIATRGGQYQGTDLDTQTGYVKSFLNFIGLKNLEFIYAEGLNLGEESQKAALANAHETLMGLAQ